MFRNETAGVVEETVDGYIFAYDPAFLSQGQAISQSLPLRPEPFVSHSLFPFFRGLLPEGWYREITCKTLKLDEKDDFGLLANGCADCIGAVWIQKEGEK